MYVSSRLGGKTSAVRGEDGVRTCARVGGVFQSETKPQKLCGVGTGPALCLMLIRLLKCVYKLDLLRVIKKLYIFLLKRNFELLKSV